MKNNITIRTFEPNDVEDIQLIFNHYARESYAAYTDKEYPKSFINKRIKQALVFLVMVKGKTVIGFGYISPYSPFKNCGHVGVLTYFLAQEFTGRGLGTRIFNRLIAEGKNLGMTNYLAHISSKNEASLNFHKKHGFSEVGRFKEVAVKFNEAFDVVWVQKIIKKN